MSELIGALLYKKDFAVWDVRFTILYFPVTRPRIYEIEGVEVIVDDHDVYVERLFPDDGEQHEARLIYGVGSMTSEQPQAKQREMPFSSIQSLLCRPHVECSWC
ncbi:uncharacterized protein LOC141874064 [Acropora palmata]|uniref:uncharacterized protein LOC141874064 n=1 Tax=Acropora palmata TaxID=6131 RepID=UPI003DA17DE4